MSASRVSLQGSAKEIGFSVDTFWPEPHVAVVTPVGEVDVFTAPELERELVSAIGRGAELVVLDMKDTSFVDSVALGVLLRTLRRLEQRGGDLRIAGAHRNVLRVLEMTSLDKVFAIHASRETALGRSSPVH